MGPSTPASRRFLSRRPVPVRAAAPALRSALAGAIVLGASVTPAPAFCDSTLETYALFQCAETAYVEPVPSPYAPADVEGVFWQVGFGSTGPTPAGSGKFQGPRDTGGGVSGTGVEAGTRFNGNDSGLFPVDVLDAAAVFPTLGFPPGSVCLGSNNWANNGVDGCCDNPRSGQSFDYGNLYYGLPPYALPYAADDNILNPYYGTYFAAIGYPGYYSLASVQDYPTAVLLTLPAPGGGTLWFALMAVASMDRGNTGDTRGGLGGCPAPDNPAVCDARDGFYDFGGVVNGGTNLITGEADAVPWQRLPRIELQCLAGCTRLQRQTHEISFRPARIHHDGRALPTNQPTLDARNPSNGEDATRAAGAGVVDLMRRWAGLVRYDLQAAPLEIDPNGRIDHDALVWGPLLDPNGRPFSDLTPPLDADGEPVSVVSVFAELDPGTCVRAVVKVGKPPELTDPALTTAEGCRTGRCGDVGYAFTASDPLNVNCSASALASEAITGAAVERSRGLFRITWASSGELSVTGFEVAARGRRGERTVAAVSCRECTTGLPAEYAVTVSRGDLRRVGRLEAFRITMQGGNGGSVDLPVEPGGARR